MFISRRALPLAVLCAASLGGAFAAAAAEPKQCRQGYVWRSAAVGDYVCVTPESRQRARDDNAAATSRRAPSAEFGPMACKQGFVWRSAFQGDMVCVTPEVRAETKRENELAATRVADALVGIEQAQIDPKSLPGKREICIFEHIDYKGRSRCFDKATEVPSFCSVSAGWNDQISSIRINGKFTISYCEHAQFKGECRSISESAPRLGVFNDKISSFVIYRNE